MEVLPKLGLAVSQQRITLPLGQHVRDSHQVPLFSFTGIKSILDLLPDVPALVQHPFLGEVSSMQSLCHESFFL
jgi:hypothetical protein